MLMDIKGGYLQLGDYSDFHRYSENIQIMENNFPKQTVLGSSWTKWLVKVGDTPKGVRFEGNINMESLPVE